MVDKMTTRCKIKKMRSINLALSICAFSLSLIFYKSYADFKKAERLFNSQSIKLEKEYRKLKFVKARRLQ